MLDKDKILHYQIYQNGAVGLCNILMSVENALIIAKLTNRNKIIFYCPKALFNSTTGKTLFDLYDVHFNYELVRSDLIDDSIESLPYNFHTTCIYYKEYPTDAFLNGRTQIMDISNYIEKESFRTINNDTLSFYSYLFYIKDVELLKEIHEFIRRTVVPKQQYLSQAHNILKDIIDVYGEFNSIAVRRGDYMYINDTNNKYVQVEDFYLDDLAKNVFLLIHTDETDVSYFKTIGIDNYWCIQQSLTNEDVVEKGLISLIIASYSTTFIGTLLSTYTSYIQRYRMYNFKNEQFKFLYSQRQDLILEKGMIPKGEYSWSNLPDSLRNIAFWISEYKESYKTK